MDFFVRCKCKFRRFTGGKSRNLHAADGGKGIARRAAELCGGALTISNELLGMKGSMQRTEEFNAVPSAELVLPERRRSSPAGDRAKSHRATHGACSQSFPRCRCRGSPANDAARCCGRSAA